MDFFNTFVQELMPELPSSATIAPSDLTPLRPMIVNCLALATNKNPDVRRSALAAVAAAYCKDCCAVAWAISELPSSPQAAVRKALQPTLATIDADVEVIDAATHDMQPLPEAMATASPLVVKVSILYCPFIFRQDYVQIVQLYC